MDLSTNGENHMALTSKATLTTAEPNFARYGTTRGVWKGDTVTCCHEGRRVLLKTDEKLSEFLPDGRSCCDLIRVGDEFFVGVGIGDAKQLMRGFKEIWALSNHRTAAPKAGTSAN